VIPEGVLGAVDYLLKRFGFALDREAAFKAKEGKKMSTVNAVAWFSALGGGGGLGSPA
jgi:hypothetical protein